MFREISKDIVSKKQEDTVKKMNSENKTTFLEPENKADEMKKINTRIVDKNLVILHEKEQKQKEDNQRKTKKTKKNQFISVHTEYPTAN